MNASSSKEYPYLQPSAQKITPVVKQVDHVVVLSSNPGQIFDLFTGTLGLPVAWPFSHYPGFATGGVQMGNVNIETIQFDRGTPPFYRGAPTPYREGGLASIFGIVFDPHPLRTIAEELLARGTAPGDPHDQMGKFDGRTVKLWTSMFLEALGLDSYVIYLCEYSRGYKGMLEHRAAMPPLGRIGLMSIREIAIGVKDLAATQKLWDAFLAPVKGIRGRYAVGPGPAVHLTGAAEDRIMSLVLEVTSLEKASIFLERNGLLGEVSADSIVVEPSSVQALELRLVERQ